MVASPFPTKSTMSQVQANTLSHDRVFGSTPADVALLKDQEAADREHRQVEQQRDHPAAGTDQLRGGAGVPDRYREGGVDGASVDAGQEFDGLLHHRRIAKQAAEHGL